MRVLRVEQTLIVLTRRTFHPERTVAVGFSVRFQTAKASLTVGRGRSRPVLTALTGSINHITAAEKNEETTGTSFPPLDRHLQA